MHQQEKKNQIACRLSRNRKVATQFFLNPKVGSSIFLWYFRNNRPDQPKFPGPLIIRSQQQLAKIYSLTSRLIAHSGVCATIFCYRLSGKAPRPFSGMVFKSGKVVHTIFPSIDDTVEMYNSQLGPTVS